MENPSTNAEAELFQSSVSAHAWQRLTPMNEARSRFAAVALENQIIVFGGYTSNGYLNWSSVESMESSSLFVDKADSDEKDSTRNPSLTEEWTTLPDFKHARCGFGAAVVSVNAATNANSPNNSIQPAQHVVIAGGCDGGSALRSAEMYNFKKKEWRVLPDMHTKRDGCAVTCCCVDGGEEAGNGGVYVVGGWFEGNCHDTVEYLDTRNLQELTHNSTTSSTARWTLMLERMSESRGYCGAVMMNCQNAEEDASLKLVVVGGCNHRGAMKSAEYFCFRSRCTRKWNTLPPMHFARWGCAAVAVGPCVFVVGGSSEEAAETMEYFDFRTHRWTLLPNRLSTPRYGHAAVVVDEHIMVMGGYWEDSYLNSVEIVQIGDPFPSHHVKLPKLPRVDGPLVSLEQRTHSLEDWCATAKAKLSKVKASVEKMKEIRDREEEEIGAAHEVYEKAVQAARDGRTGMEKRLMERTSGWIETTEQELRQMQEQLCAAQSIMPGKPPSQLLCYWTKEVMVDPVMATDSHTYERKRIETYFAIFPENENPTSPVTKEKLLSRTLLPNLDARAMCESHRKNEWTVKVLLEEANLEGKK